MELALIIGAVVVAVAAVVYLLTRRSGPAQSPLAAQHLETGRALAEETESKPRLNWLVGRRGETEGKAYHLGYRTITIGRAPHNFIQVTDKDASRIHCQVTPREGFLQVVDMRSRNGTFVNGSPITHGRMAPGSTLKIGGCEFVYEIEAAVVNDDSRERKVGGKDMVASTEMDGGLTAKELFAMALKDANGDVEKAAQSVGLAPEVFREVLRKAGLL